MSLFRSELSEHLTRPDPDQTRAAMTTYPGQAHFAGGGPAGKSCLDCAFYGVGSHDWHSKNGKHHGRIKPASCQKYRQLTGATGARVPDDAHACRHFEQHENPPRRFDK